MPGSSSNELSLRSRRAVTDRRDVEVHVQHRQTPAHRRLIEPGRQLPVDLKGGAIFQACVHLRTRRKGPKQASTRGSLQMMNSVNLGSNSR